MAAPKVTEREVRFARSFIKYLRGNQMNTYLLLAVIAWMRSEVGVNMRFMYNRNNPFNIRRSRFAYAYRRAGNNGSFAMFASLDIGAKATVAFLKENAAFGKYTPIIRAAQRASDTNSERVKQAVDFIMAIAMSKWSAGNYGWKPATQGRWVTRELPNGSTETIWVPGQPERPPSILRIWSGITGTTIPQSWFQDPVKTTKQVTKKVIRPRQPRSLEHTLPEPDYIKPYAAAKWYDERPHFGQQVLNDPADV